MEERKWKRLNGRGEVEECIGNGRGEVEEKRARGKGKKEMRKGKRELKELDDSRK